jgi:hypothetical protein
LNQGKEGYIVTTTIQSRHFSGFHFCAGYFRSSGKMISMCRDFERRAKVQQGLTETKAAWMAGMAIFQTFSSAG